MHRGAHGCWLSGFGHETAVRGQNPRARAQSTENKKSAYSRRFADGETRTRTGDTTIFSRVLYQLSYLAVGSDGSEFGAFGGVLRS
jgi:hypothetical protein